MLWMTPLLYYLGITYMGQSEEKLLSTTRMTFLRLSAQTYSRLGNLLGPLITTIKILASRSCELAGINELEVDLKDRDEEFVTFAKEFIVNLRKVKQIRPFARCWVKRNHKLLGFLVYLDGGRPGLGSCLYAISTEDGEHIEKALCLANGRLCKRNVVAHEILSKVLGGEDLYRLLQPLLYDHSETALRFYIKGDSLCGLAMLNSQIAIKSTLMENAIKSYLDTLTRITIEF